MTLEEHVRQAVARGWHKCTAAVPGEKDVVDPITREVVDALAKRQDSMALREKALQEAALEAEMASAAEPPGCTTLEDVLAYALKDTPVSPFSEEVSAEYLERWQYLTRCLPDATDVAAVAIEQGYVVVDIVRQGDGSPHGGSIRHPDEFEVRTSRGDKVWVAEKDIIARKPAAETAGG